MNALHHNKYIKYLTNRGFNTLANQLIYLIERDFLDDLQDFLNKKYNSDLVVDGILGMNTLNAIDTAISKDNRVIDTFIDTHSPKPKNLKTRLLNFLADAEGTIIHFNAKTEHSYTTPYGIYRYAFPNAPIIKYVDSLYRKYGLNINSPKAARIINSKLTSSEKLTIKEMAWEFYKENFIDERLLEVLDDMTSITYLNIAINGGKSRGVKSLQAPIKTSIDGKLGPATLKNLRVFIEREGFKELNFGMLEYMYLFYKRLMERRAKFRTYRRGWYNRLLKTSCGLFQKKYTSL